MTGARPPLRVVIVDDHPMFRMGLAVAIADMDGIELVGEAEAVDAVPALIAATAPDVMLLDVRLGDGSGLEVNRRLHDEHPDVKVIMLTMSDDGDTMRTALRDGACGYLVKGAGPERVENAVRVAATGDVVIDRNLVATIVSAPQTRGRFAEGPLAGLTERELEVLELVARGHGNHVIAKQLYLSPKTVSNHVSIILTKLNAADRSQAIVIARRAGLGDQEDRVDGLGRSEDSAPRPGPGQAGLTQRAHCATNAREPFLRKDRRQI